MPEWAPAVAFWAPIGVALVVCVGIAIYTRSVIRSVREDQRRGK